MVISPKQDSVGRRIHFIFRQTLVFIEREMAHLKIGRSTLHFLNHIYHHDGIRPEQIAKVLGVDRSTATRALKKLETQGYIRREPDPSDGRALLVRATEKAWEHHWEIKEVLRRLTAVLTDGFTDEERELTHILLGRMEANLTRHLEEHTS